MWQATVEWTTNKKALSDKITGKMFQGYAVSEDGTQREPCCERAHRSHHKALLCAQKRAKWATLEQADRESMARLRAV